uniref:Uncharacterized protein n=1 Tax=Romanomermis culicivorax TaxID=13658 RepID=A0A915KPN2_ROMCU
MTLSNRTRRGLSFDTHIVDILDFERPTNLVAEAGFKFKLAALRTCGLGVGVVGLFGADRLKSGAQTK